MTENVSVRRPEGVTLIAVYHFMAGALGALGALCLGALVLVPVSIFVGDDVALSIVSLVTVAALSPFLLIGAANLLVGWGLLRLESWARWSAIALSILRLVGFPLFTVIGGVMIAYLFTDEASQAFEAGSFVRAAKPKAEALPVAEALPEAAPPVESEPVEEAAVEEKPKPKRKPRRKAKPKTDEESE